MINSNQINNTQLMKQKVSQRTQLEVKSVINNQQNKKNVRGTKKKYKKFGVKGGPIISLIFVEYIKQQQFKKKLTSLQISCRRTLQKNIPHFFSKLFLGTGNRGFPVTSLGTGTVQLYSYINGYSIIINIVLQQSLQNQNINLAIFPQNNKFAHTFLDQYHFQANILPKTQTLHLQQRRVKRYTTRRANVFRHIISNIRKKEKTSPRDVIRFTSSTLSGREYFFAGIVSFYYNRYVLQRPSTLQNT
eukprot:TRINITY_DN2538_c0_g1_i1.p1 TRINITY_DN2538_c0_g1~~TRINITY_DN2538_c0_g1_i1.p1  ORF type:complete len:246 (+),score=2.46 TRINITY_DN2538_c0_g1_i1:832-1569(+)